MINEKLQLYSPHCDHLVPGLACCMMALATTARMARTSCPAWEGEAGLQCSGPPVAASPIQTFQRELPDYHTVHIAAFKNMSLCFHVPVCYAATKSQFKTQQNHAIPLSAWTKLLNSLFQMQIVFLLTGLSVLLCACCMRFCLRACMHVCVCVCIRTL